MQKSQLDFIVIGAIKSGTTSLFHHLSRHPDVFLPKGKEYNFFTRDDWYSQGLDWFLSEYYAESRQGAVRGLVSPAFMADVQAPGRIHATLPDVKLVAILRNPIDRAVSEWQMMKRKEFESRPLEVALEQALATPPDDQRRFSASDTGTYLERGLYARILARYLENFPRARLHVMFLEDLEERPEQTYADLLSFLGVRHEIPPDLRRKHHVGGARKRFPNLLRRLSLLAPLRAAWRSIPKDVRKQILLRYETDINIDRKHRSSLDSALRSKLASYFAADVARLKGLTTRVPWPDFAITSPSPVAHARR